MKSSIGSMAAICMAGACALSGAANESQAGDYRISGPFTHANLSVFLIHGAGNGARKYMTLQEGLAQHKVVVYETRNVNELAIENTSKDRDVYIQSGEIVKGGQQDRTFGDDFILTSNSGKVPIAAFCVEHGRWTRRGQESSTNFAAAPNAIATKSMKLAVRRSANQGAVWSSVAAAQAMLASSLNTAVASPVSPSSFQLSLENKGLRDSTKNYAEALSGIVAGKADAIGYAFAINGKVNSADVYASPELFRKLWPKLLEASAVEAVSESRSANDGKATIESVKRALLDPEHAKGTAKSIGGRTRILTKETDKTILFESGDEKQNGAWIHRNYIAK